VGQSHSAFRAPISRHDPKYVYSASLQYQAKQVPVEAGWVGGGTRRSSTGGGRSSTAWRQVSQTQNQHKADTYNHNRFMIKEPLQKGQANFETRREKRFILDSVRSHYVMVALQALNICQYCVSRSRNICLGGRTTPQQRIFCDRVSVSGSPSTPKQPSSCGGWRQQIQISLGKTADSISAASFLRTRAVTIQAPYCVQGGETTTSCLSQSPVPTRTAAR